MSTTRVYEFTCFHIATRRFSVVASMASAETIALLGCRKVPHSEQDVPSELVDAMGFYPHAALALITQHCPRAHLEAMGYSAAHVDCAAVVVIKPSEDPRPAKAA